MRSQHGRTWFVRRAPAITAFLLAGAALSSASAFALITPCLGRKSTCLPTSVGPATALEWTGALLLVAGIGTYLDLATLTGEGLPRGFGRRSRDGANRSTLPWAPIGVATGTALFAGFLGTTVNPVVAAAFLVGTLVLGLACAVLPRVLDLASHLKVAESLRRTQSPVISPQRMLPLARPPVLFLPAPAEPPAGRAAPHNGQGQT